MEFWEAKIARNRHRDEVTETHLVALGWHVITVWECELRGKSILASRLDELAEEIRHAGVLKKIKEGQKLQTEETARKHREELLRKQAKLEEEINSLYPIPKKIKKDAESFA